MQRVPFQPSKYHIVDVLKKNPREGSAVCTALSLEDRVTARGPIRHGMAVVLKQHCDSELLLYEFNVLSELEHPNIVRVYEFLQGRNGRPSCIVMESAGSSDMETWLGIQQSLGRNAACLPQFYSIMRQLSEAVQYMHAQQVVHADIKRKNILVDGKRAVLIDFGIAQTPAKECPISAYSGTRATMAPEQWRGEALPASDVYGMGVVAYAALTDRYPRNEERLGMLSLGRTPELFYRKIKHVRELNPSVGRQCGELVHACLATRASERPRPDELVKSFSRMEQNYFKAA